MKKILFLVLMLTTVWWSYAMSPSEFAQSVGANENLIRELELWCWTMKDPDHCFGIGLAISNAESNMWLADSSHWYFWRVTSPDKSTAGFVRSYSKFYYKRDKYNEWWMFYGYSPKSPAPTRYCVSEEQPDGTIIHGHCPNWRTNFNRIYDQYKSKVMWNQNTKNCRFLWYVEEWDYIQLDSMWGQLMQIIRPSSKQKIFTCSN